MATERGVRVLVRRNNWPIYSRERIENTVAFFFQNAVGGRRHDGTRVEATDSNLLIGGMLAAPLIYDAYSFRVYGAALSLIEREMEIIEMGFSERPFRVPFPHVLPGREPLAVRHIPLPEPERTEAWSKVTCPFEKATLDFIRYINAEEIPCVEVGPPNGDGGKWIDCAPRRTPSGRYGPLSPIAWRASVLSREWDGTSLWGVLCGDLWYPDLKEQDL